MRAILESGALNVSVVVIFCSQHFETARGILCTEDLHRSIALWMVSWCQYLSKR